MVVTEKRGLMKQEHLNAQWVALAHAWIKEARTGRNPTRNGLLDEPMLRLCGDVAGLKVLDCGCGEGRFCRILLARGAAAVLGLDLCEPMIKAAQELDAPGAEYRIADVQNLSFITDETFDLAISYLNHCDLADFMANIRAVFRVLRVHGRFIIANLHPMRSATGSWLRTPTGEKLHVILDRYFEEGERNWRMMGVDFTNFHRTLETYLTGFLSTGFILEHLIEPTLTREQLERYPELDDEVRVPNFIIFGLRKPAAR